MKSATSTREFRFGFSVRFSRFSWFDSGKDPWRSGYDRRGVDIDSRASISFKATHRLKRHGETVGHRTGARESGHACGQSGAVASKRRRRYRSSRLNRRRCEMTIMSRQKSAIPQHPRREQYKQELVESSRVESYFNPNPVFRAVRYRFRSAVRTRRDVR